MLRWMVGVRKKTEESLPDYVERATHTAEDVAEKYGGRDWASLYRKRKWAFAGKAARMQDGRWTTRLLNWSPFFRCLPYRSVGHPQKRWDDHIVNLAGGNWVTAAHDNQLWATLSDGFIYAL